MRIFFLSAFCFVILLNANSQEKSNPEKLSITSTCDQVMNAFEKQDYDKVILLLKQNSNVDPVALDSLKPEIIRAMNVGAENYGRFLGIDFIMQKNVGQIASRRYYAIRFEKYFLKCQFSLYNNGEKWLITGFNFNEDFSDLF